MSAASAASTAAPVTADDLEQIVRLAVRALADAPADAWARPAAGLEWDCWETAEHLADDFFAYAAQLGPAAPPLDRYVPFAADAARPGAPVQTLRADRAAGPAGLLQVLEASGALLVAMVRTADPATRAWHPMGTADPEGWAAMGIVEAAVHTHDLAAGLGVDWQPPAGICARTLHRLFPDAPRDTDPWATLLWATGRGTLPGRDRLTAWRWYAQPRP
ncbi:maleylpyruvate isomerase N-terminal domain-containing protein [Streptomyces sp. AA0539]|uniref:maleylpyruvate isomerase N-terminal domain-containing protein n=1 Tax=Streptomyces sp. AA0539 TaxID=1210045 RepID=UPI0002EF56B7|nr:DinB family protein [Streptomyces sp. AA0539]